MKCIRYWWLVLRTALSHSLTVAQDIIFILLIVTGLAAWKIPVVKTVLAKADIDIGGWQIATIVLGTIVGIRLVMSPYWIYQEQAVTITSLSKRLQNRLSKKQVREQVGRFMERGKRILVAIHNDGVLPEQEMQNWDSDVKAWLNENLDSSYGARFRSPKTHPEPPRGIGSETLRLAWTGTRFRLDNLREILEEHT